MTQPNFQISIVDLPDLSETFADSIEKIGFENGLWKLDFYVTRLGEPKNNVVPGKKITVCRLVLPAQTGLELAGKLQGLLQLMEKQGVLKRTPIINPTQGSQGKPN